MEEPQENIEQNGVTADISPDMKINQLINSNDDEKVTEESDHIEENEVALAEQETEQQIVGKGTFRGRPWNAGCSPSRFRGRGFGPMAPAVPRGRGGPMQGSFFRGRGNMHGGRFSGQNFDQNWNPQQVGNGIYNPMFSSQPPELWIETKSEEGKSYYYHALSRETTWTKPEGSNIKIMTQAEVDAMNAKNQGTQATSDNSSKDGLVHNSGPAHDNDNKSENLGMNQSANRSETVQNSVSLQLQQPPPQAGQHQQQHPQHPPNFFPNAPPYFGNSPFGMPPPGYGGYPPTSWGVPPWGMSNSHVLQAEQPAKNLIIKPGIIDPAVIARAAEWSEHRAPDGRPYYYHTGRGESVWEKPQAIRDLEAARMAAHSGATPQISTPPQHPPGVMPGPMLGSGVPMVGGVQFDPTAAFNAKGNTTEFESNADKNNKDKEKNSKLEMEKKKKEEDDKNKQVNKQQDKSRPIHSTPIAGTPWCVVWTGDGRVFFYNPSTRTSVWERPEELLDRADVDKAISNLPEQLLDKREKQKEEKTPSPKEEDENKTESECIVEEVLAKKPKLSNIEVKVEQKKDNDIGKEAAIEAEVRAAKERSLVPLDVRVKQFKEMLREKDVSAFSTWEKELHKIVFDQRYLLLTSRERKQVFEKYVKERAEEERKEKRNKMRQKREDFRNLMESANLHGRSSFSDFSQKYGKDERYKAIEKVRERESLFNEFIIDVRRKEKEEKIYRREQIKKDFFDMLRERDDITRHSRWSDMKRKFEQDARYKAVDGSSLREEYFIEFCRFLRSEHKKHKDSKDKEKERDRRDKDKEKDRKERSKKESADKKDDKHEDNVLEKKKNEEYDDEDHSTDDDAERLQKERDRQLRAEQSIKEREKEVQRTLANHLRDRDKEREHHKRDESIKHFNALLADLVRNPDLSWKEAKRILRKDHRWEIVENLDREDRERVFNDHIGILMRKKRDKFREMLDELPDLQLTSSWKDVKKQVRDDPRYLKYNNNEKCEREFKDYIKDKTVEARNSLKQLLQECKLITHKSYEMVQENLNHLKEIEDILKNDKRYLNLNHVAQERTNIIMTYLEDIHRRGPPPPPTACDSRRK